MFVPLPILIALGVVFAILVVLALRRARARDPLLGGQPPVYRPAPLRHQPTANATVDVSGGGQSNVMSPEVQAQVVALISAGRKIEAIKVAKEATRLGLKESKDLVEGLE
ncbi:ribosomal protein L7/L12 [Sphingomonas sp. ERG5]|uniref:ribosomal protein L7/L12 n=1 Tax=Sphingomonas sp. ERG5 TaxID=1381597 RepID=UPI00054B3138|nr:ribosomal protein L7/L12 [Sphingomonas sp. ERG5]